MARRSPVVAAVVALALAGSAAYTVQPGDTLSALAERFGTTVAALARANGIADPDRIVAGERLTVPSRRAASPADRAEVGRLIERVARAHGWNPAFVQALAWQESGWQQSRVSATGAVGIMQVQPETGRFVSRHLAGRPLDLRDPEDNVTAGVLFLHHLWHLTDGDVRATLVGYFQGLASARRNGVYPETRRYVANVLALRERFATG